MDNFNILDLMLGHETQVNEAIKKKQYRVALLHIIAMKELIPKPHESLLSKNSEVEN